MNAMSGWYGLDTDTADIAPSPSLQTVQKLTRHRHAVVEARRVFQRGDGVERGPQAGMRLSNLGQEGTAVA